MFICLEWGGVFVAMRNCLDCERARLRNALQCRTSGLVWGRSLDYEFYHKGNTHEFKSVPVQGLTEGAWFRPLCNFHRQRPGSPGPAHVFDPRVGVYPDRNAFFRVGVPMVQEARREALMAFEDTDEQGTAQKKVRGHP